MTQKEYKNMSETGHAKNVENWQKMIAACTGFGGAYKPSNVNLEVGSMTARKQIPPPAQGGLMRP
jgi:hypothetical protein